MKKSLQWQYFGFLKECEAFSSGVNSSKIKVVHITRAQSNLQTNICFKMKCHEMSIEPLSESENQHFVQTVVNIQEIERATITTFQSLCLFS